MSKLLPVAALLVFGAGSALAEPARSDAQTASARAPQCADLKEDLKTTDPNADVRRDGCAHGGLRKEHEAREEREAQNGRGRSEPSPGNYNGTPGGELTTDKEHRR